MTHAGKQAITVLPGVIHYPGYYDADACRALVDQLRRIAEDAPFFTPTMPKTNKPFSVRMTNCGSLGWVSDQAGYRYQPDHPVTKRPWPPLPAELAALWQDVAAGALPPEACLVNYYEPTARMGLHQDRDEQTFDAPVVSVSLGDTALFRIGGTDRRDPTRSFRLQSGDVLVFGGPARLAFHGIDRLYAGSSTLLDKGGRLNLTLRRVTPKP